MKNDHIGLKIATNEFEQFMNDAISSIQSEFSFDGRELDSGLYFLQSSINNVKLAESKKIIITQ